ncbi:MAG: thiamine pyrophosphate-binding protein [Thaumarchaeota archaeon]|nr:thiamine pyrophosphate-binding protein [Nitrososphaerota archaeon]
MTVTGGRAVVQVLEEEGVDTVFGIPALHTLPVYDALFGHKQIRHIQVRNEQGAAFMAYGYAAAKGKPGVCLLGAGPGSTNAVTGVSEAYLDSIPVVVIGGGISKSLRGKGAIHELDQISIFQPVTRWSGGINSTSEIANALRKAFRAAVSDRPGPVFIEFPFDTLSAKIDQIDGITELEEKPNIDHGKIKQAAEILCSASKPVFIVGGGAVSAEATELIKDLARTIGAPVGTTISAKGAFPDADALSLGLLWDEVSLQAVSESDAALALGCRFSERSTAGWRLKVPSRLIHVDIDPHELDRNYPTFLAVHGDLKEFLSLLKDEIEARRFAASDRREWLNSIDVLKEKRDARYKEMAKPTDVPFKPQRIIQEISEALPNDAIVVAETGYAFWYSSLMLKINKPRSYISPSGNVAVGFGLPAAIGAKLAKPERPVIALCGDGGFMMTCNEIATAVENKIPFLTVVFNDSGYGAIREYQRRGFGSRFIGVDFMNPDIPALARSFGAIGVKIDKAGDTRDAVAAFIKSDKPVILEVPVDKSERVVPAFLTDRYRA